MNSRIVRITKLMVSIFVLSLLTACPPKLVPIPPANQDHSPLVTINATPSGPVRVSLQQAASDSCADICVSFVSQGGDAVITAAASNPGGVKSLTVELLSNVYPFSTQASANITATPNADNLVPETLGVLGFNGSGGIGPNAFIYHADPNNLSGQTVKATAENFNNQKAISTLLLQPISPIQASITAGPSTLIIGQNQSTRLIFTFYGATSARVMAKTVNTPKDSTIPNPHEVWKIPPGPLTWAAGGNGNGYVDLPLLLNDNGTLAKIQQDTEFTITATNYLYDECVAPNKLSCAGAQMVSAGPVRVNVNAPSSPPCGGLGQPCCTGSSCSTGLQCQNNVCVSSSCTAPYVKTQCGTGLCPAGFHVAKIDCNATCGAISPPPCWNETVCEKDCFNSPFKQCGLICPPGYHSAGNPSCDINCASTCMGTSPGNNAIWCAKD